MDISDIRYGHECILYWLDETGDYKSLGWIVSVMHDSSRSQARRHHDRAKIAGEGARTTLRSRAYDGSHVDSLLVPHSLLPYSRFQMQNRTETLGIGSRAPEFSLTAANRQGNFSLSTLRAQGLAVLEFLRGTW
jgi:hypothetical protein